MELDLDRSPRFASDGDPTTEPLGEGDLDGVPEYDFLELTLERTEVGDPLCTGVDALDLCESGLALLDLSPSSSESFLKSSNPISVYNQKFGQVITARIRIRITLIDC